VTGPSDYLPVIFPTGDLIPDGDSGVLLGVRRVPPAPLGSSVPRHDYVYRATDQGKVIYKLALPDIAGLRVDDGMVLNDENQACTAIGGLVLCFDSLSDKELWRYDTGTARVTIIFAAEDGSVVVEDSNRHILALDKHGNKTTDKISILQDRLLPGYPIGLKCACCRARGRRALPKPVPRCSAGIGSRRGELA
jgi:outer membrane protein assembly factor BamB